MATSKILVRNDAAAITWKNSGGSFALTLTSVASASAREGGKADLTAVHAARYAMRFTWKMTTAPTAGTVIELWWTSSLSATAGTGNTGVSVTGADAAWAPSGTVAEVKKMLQFIVAAPDAGSTCSLARVAEFVFFPPTRYGAPIVVNLTNQALAAAGADCFIEMVPLEDEAQ